MAGIRVRDGEELRVAHNRIEGPWYHLVMISNLSSSLVEQNSGFGAQHNALNMVDLARGHWSSANIIRNNQFADVGDEVAYVSEACGNLFQGNNFRDSGIGVSVTFTETTGANVLRGNAREVVDDGAHDCDGDGMTDPNRIAGKGTDGTA